MEGSTNTFPTLQRPEAPASAGWLRLVAGHCCSHIGRKFIEIVEERLRVREYLIAYAPDEKALWVVAVVHGRHNPRVLAAIL